MVSFKPKGTYELPKLHSLLPNVLQFKMDNLKISLPLSCSTMKSSFFCCCG